MFLFSVTLAGDGDFSFGLDFSGWDLYSKSFSVTAYPNLQDDAGSQGVYIRGFVNKDMMWGLRPVIEYRAFPRLKIRAALGFYYTDNDFYLVNPSTGRADTGQNDTTHIQGGDEENADGKWFVWLMPTAEFAFSDFFSVRGSFDYCSYENSGRIYMYNIRLEGKFSINRNFYLLAGGERVFSDGPDTSVRTTDIGDIYLNRDRLSEKPFDDIVNTGLVLGGGLFLPTGGKLNFVGDFRYSFAGEDYIIFNAGFRFRP
jgi:hypothetical protein